MDQKAIIRNLIDLDSTTNICKQGENAIVVMSGGQDSTTALSLAIHIHGTEHVNCIAFDYGQKHKVELEQAEKICWLLGVHLEIVPVPALRLMKSSGLVNHGAVDDEHMYLEGRPSSFVPARNAMFLTIAFGIAMERRAEYIYTGVCQTDYSGYPDCRASFVSALNKALCIGYETTIQIETPIMHLDKAHTFLLAHELNCLGLITKRTHTCYNGVRDVRHEWGAGCGECPACDLRAKGYADYLKLGVE